MNGAAHALRQAASIFAKSKMDLFEGLRLPDMEPFRQAARMPVRHTEHAALTDTTLARMHQAAEQLRVQDARLWLVHMVMRHLGLRPSEALEAELGWLMRAEWGQWFLAVVVTEKHRPKATAGYTPLVESVAREILAVRRALAAQTGELLVDGSPLIPGKSYSDRYDAIYVHHSRWMRAFVPAEKYRGSNYELRRWATQVIRRKYPGRMRPRTLPATRRAT